MDLFSLNRKTAIVTGALGLIGRQHCEALAAAGAHVIVADVDAELARQFAGELGAQHLGIGLDVTNRTAVLQALVEISDKYDTIDILVNNAAINDMFENPLTAKEHSAFENYPLEAFQRSLDVNVTGVFLCSQVFGTKMAEQGNGSIINIASTYGMVGPDQTIYRDECGEQTFYKSAAYPVTKGAVINFTRFLAAYWGNKGVRVNTLSPGGVENGQHEFFIHNYSAKTLLGRMAKASDYQGALIFLASEASAYMTGANLVVDGRLDCNLTNNIMKEVLKEKASRIRLLITDCDGVLTDGGVYYGEEGECLKKFNIRDGMGVERLRRLTNIETAIITGENSPSLVQRAKKLQIAELHLLAKDKPAVFREIVSRLGLHAGEVAYIGDDYNDLEVMKLAGFTACPADALPGVKTQADFVCQSNGGEGCFREFAELIIDMQSPLVQTASKNDVITLNNGRKIGPGEPCYIIAEIGINHNGSLEIVKKLIDEAVTARADAVKFQKRTPERCVPKDQWEVMRDTPWGRMSYIDYKRKTEFGIAEYATIDQYCKKAGIDWFVSTWDTPSVDFMEQFDTVIYKLASASLTDFQLIERVLDTGRPLMLSTGMSTMKEIENALAFIHAVSPGYPLFVAHSTSAYPCKPEELNLRMIQTLQHQFPGIPIGYSGHETGLATTVGAVAMGATFVERHFTLDRAMWGSDHAASVEPQGFQRLARDIRDLEAARGDGIKRVYDSELGPMKRLRVNISDEYKEKSL